MQLAKQRKSSTTAGRALAPWVNQAGDRWRRPQPPSTMALAPPVLCLCVLRRVLCAVRLL